MHSVLCSKLLLLQAREARSAHVQGRSKAMKVNGPGRKLQSLISGSWWVNVQASLPSDEITLSHDLPASKCLHWIKSHFSIDWPTYWYYTLYWLPSLWYHTHPFPSSVYWHYLKNKQTNKNPPHTQMFISGSFFRGPNLRQQLRKWKLSHSDLTSPGSCVCVYSMCYLPPYHRHSPLETTTQTQFGWVLVLKPSWPILSYLHLGQWLSSVINSQEHTGHLWHTV